MIKEFKLIKNIFARKTPRYVVFFVTSKCNVRCKMCFNWKNVINANESENLTINEIKKIYLFNIIMTNSGINSTSFNSSPSYNNSY